MAMPFLIDCPHCGAREATEFEFGGELLERPTEAPPNRAELGEYLYFRANAAGPQREWWFHAAGCGRWLVATRDTTTCAVRLTAPAEWSAPPPAPDARA